MHQAIVDLADVVLNAIDLTGVYRTAVDLTAMHPATVDPVDQLAVDLIDLAALDSVGPPNSVYHTGQRSFWQARAQSL